MADMWEDLKDSNEKARERAEAKARKTAEGKKAKAFGRSVKDFEEVLRDIIKSTNEKKYRLENIEDKLERNIEPSFEEKIAVYRDRGGLEELSRFLRRAIDSAVISRVISRQQGNELKRDIVDERIEGLISLADEMIYYMISNHPEKF